MRELARHAERLAALSLAQLELPIERIRPPPATQLMEQDAAVSRSRGMLEDL